MRAGRNETLSFDEKRRQKVVPRPTSELSDALVAVASVASRRLRRRFARSRRMKSRTAVNEVSSCYCHRASRYPLSISLPWNLIRSLSISSFLPSLNPSRIFFQRITASSYFLSVIKKIMYGELKIIIWKIIWVLWMNCYLSHNFNVISNVISKYYTIVVIYYGVAVMRTKLDNSFRSTV